MSERLKLFTKPNYKEVILALLLILVLLAAGLWSIVSNYQTHEKLYLDKQVSTQAVAWHAVELIHRTGIDAYFNAQVNKPDVLSLLQEAQDPDTEKMARLKLYRLLYPLYLSLKIQGIDIFHFHTTDVRSFFRFHQPEQFGCDLSSARSSLDKVRQLRQPLHGFEVGLLYSGYRHIYPLIDQGVYLGSVELSQPFESLRQEMSQLNRNKEYTLIHQKSALVEKRLMTFGNLMQESSFLLIGWKKTRKEPCRMRHRR